MREPDISGHWTHLQKTILKTFKWFTKVPQNHLVNHLVDLWHFLQMLQRGLEIARCADRVRFSAMQVYKTNRVRSRPLFGSHRAGLA